MSLEWIRQNYVTEPLPSSIVWELITDCRYRLHTSTNSFHIINYGIIVTDWNLFGFFTVTVTATDPDFNFFELDWTYLITNGNILYCSYTFPVPFWSMLLQKQFPSGIFKNLLQLQLHYFHGFWI